MVSFPDEMNGDQAELARRPATRALFKAHCHAKPGPLLLNGLFLAEFSRQDEA
jgi:hypothetical protein